ncbi:polyprenyl synthetase family protein [Clostridium celatum]|nr:farnesyl diphosphate synthase [Clostridium celatum]MCE9654739.1 polyprenyl synthetase family protein [Clostridium celatum]MDU3723020.1 polyprenyl synthetase family protein [Clostridium celatum]MDU6295822.1 polyprenyl synthetase family protein [Clostridium celatum]MDY3359303.1 farnesyl diphosphate synthase [Clostridium celatum]
MIIKEVKEEINNYLKDYFENKGSYNKIIYDSASYSINIGGKRIRPILMILTYSMYKDKWKDIIEVASAIEMIHTYSLIHDDLPCMDNDDLRRGKPTNHKVYGEDIAVLAGDALLNEAMTLMIKYSLNSVNKNALLATYKISEAAGMNGMIAGQIVDIINEGKKISADELKYMHAKKTGELIKVSIVAGALLGDAKEEEVSKLEVFGEKLGLAFQIKDDILDVIGSTEKLGKTVLSDEENNKTNFISMYGLEFCQKECKRLTNECIEILESLSVNTENLKELTLNLLDREY